MKSKLKIIVLCTGNSARSQMLMCLLNDRLGDRIRAWSAGTMPAERVHPMAIRVLEELGVAPPESCPRLVSDLTGLEFDVAVTVCDNARESCPVLPGAPETVHVGYPDPAAASGSEEACLAAFRSVRDSMDSWVRLFAVLLERGSS